MIKRWMGFLLALLALLWARLSGPSTPSRAKPSDKFRCRLKSGSGDDAVVEVSTNAASLSLFSAQAGIMIEVQPQVGQPISANWATVAMQAPNKAELSGLESEVSQVLLSGAGTYTFTIGAKKATVKGNGQGSWEIL
jgi:hypothetical protein